MAINHEGLFRLAGRAGFGSAEKMSLENESRRGLLRTMEQLTNPILRWRADGALEPGNDVVAVEEPLEIRVNGRSVAVTMRTPDHDRELAAGFLLTEGVLSDPDDLLDVYACRDLPEGEEGNVVEALLARGLKVDFARLTRHVFGISSCGLCGKATLDSVMLAFPPVAEGKPFRIEVVASLPEKLRAAQPGFYETGGLHAAALFSRDGILKIVREDIGRHNAMDKVLGRALLDGDLPLADAMLLVDGRVSFELVQKALAAGVPLVAGVGAPSTLAVECARRGNLTLVGFLRAERMNVYTGSCRVVGADSGEIEETGS